LGIIFIPVCLLRTFVKYLTKKPQAANACGFFVFGLLAFDDTCKGKSNETDL
jgi:hypothetical protein